jgi:hypothetical protein
LKGLFSITLALLLCILLFLSLTIFLLLVSGSHAAFAGTGSAKIFGLDGNNPQQIENNTFVSNCPAPYGNGNAEVESAVDPTNGYIYEEWIGCNGIGFARSTDGGATFSTPITVLGSNDSSQGFSWDPAIAVSNTGIVYAAFMHSSSGSNPGGGRPVVAISNDHGASFSQVVNVSTFNVTEFSDRDFIAVSQNGTIYVTWDYGPNGSLVSTTCPLGGSCYFNKGDFNIVISRSTDGGLTWSAPVPVSPNYPNGGAVSGPLIVEPDGQIDVLFEDYTIGADHTLGPGYNYFTTSNDGGRTWTNAILVGGGNGRYLSNTEWWIDGDLSRDNSGTLYASFDTPNSTAEDAWLTYSNNDGKSWANPIELNKGISSDLNIMPGVAGSNNSSVYVAWMANDSFGWHTYFQVYSNRLVALSKPILVSNLAGIRNVWGGDTLGLSSLRGDNGAFLSWGYGVYSSGSSSNALSEIFSSTLYNVTFTSDGNGSTVPSQNNWFSLGSTITIRATPSPGFSFEKWVTSSPQSLSIQNPTSPTTLLKISSAGQVTAEFSQTGSTTSSKTGLEPYQIALIVVGALIIAGSAFVITRRALGSRH